MNLRKLALAAAMANACASSPPPPVAPLPTASSGGSSTSEPAPVVIAPPPTPVAQSGDAPEISRSVGVQGGVVIFWPRVTPRTEDPAVHDAARRVQERLRALAERALPGRPIDVRPEPERVCPRQGCEAPTVGAMLTWSEGRCLAVLLVAPPGASPTRLVPWTGETELRTDTVPFREAPESAAVVNRRTMVECARLDERFSRREEDLVRAIQGVAPSR